MIEPNKNTKTTGTLLVYLVSTVLTIIWAGYVFSVLWAWYMPFFGLPVITIPQAIGITCLSDVLLGSRGLKALEGDEGIGAMLFYGFGIPALCLVTGWVATQFL